MAWHFSADHRYLLHRRYIWQNPETGYKEFKTSAYMAQIFRDLGYELTLAELLTIPRILQLSNDSHLFAAGIPTNYQNRLLF